MARYIDENDIYELFQPRGKANLHVSHIDVLPRADVVPRAELAREIFEEIENEINNDLKKNKKVLPQIEISNVLWNRVSGRINAFQGVLEYIAELKKKYTEADHETRN